MNGVTICGVQAPFGNNSPIGQLPKMTQNTEETIDEHTVHVLYPCGMHAESRLDDGSHVFFFKSLRHQYIDLFIYLFFLHVLI